MSEAKLDWYNKVIPEDEPYAEEIRKLLRLLRNNGFNTVSSCGHDNILVQMETYADSDMTRLYNLLAENGYISFVIKSVWQHSKEWTARHIDLRVIRTPTQTICSGDGKCGEGSKFRGRGERRAMTKDEACEKVEEAAVKHLKKYGEGSAKIEKFKDAIVLAARFSPDVLTHKQALRGRYGLGRPHDVRGHWIVRYAVRFV